MSPYQFGGEMIRQVTLDSTTYNDVPHKFEAGTPPIAEVIALKEAIAYLSYFDLYDVREHEKKLKEYALKKIEDEFGDQFHLIGDSNT
jgi:cysteine desulfurase/selenocysteine lyase